MPFSLHCFTSSSESFSIPFVGGSGPSRSQIKSSQSIGNKGQLQRTAETKDSGSKRIRIEQIPGGALHVRVCDFHFEMGKCVLSNTADCAVCVAVTATSQQDVPLGSRSHHSLCPRRCSKARRGEETVSTEEPWKKIINMDFSANQQAGADCLNVKMGVKWSSE